MNPLHPGRASNFFETVPDWPRNVLVGAEDTGLSLWTRGVGDPNEAVQRALDAGYELDTTPSNSRRDRTTARPA